MNYDKDKKRANLNDKIVTSIIYIRDITSVLEGSLSDFKPQNLKFDILSVIKYELNQ